MTPDEKISKLMEGQAKLNKLTDSLNKAMVKYATKDMEYKKALALEIQKLRTRGIKEPGEVAIKRAEGNVADLCYEKDLAKIEVDTIKQYLKIYSQQQEILRSTLAYYRATYLNT